MKKNKLSVCILTISVLGLAFFFKPIKYFAAEGGQVGHEAVIEFYLEESNEKTPSGTSDLVVDSKDTQVKKPVGRYPQTGEIIKKSFTLSGVILAVSSLYLYLKKQRKERKGENKP